MVTSIPYKTWFLMVSLSAGLGVVAVSDLNGIVVRPWNILLLIGLALLLLKLCRMGRLVNRDFTVLCLIYIISSLLSAFNSIDIFEALKRSTGNMMLAAAAIIFSQIRSQSHLQVGCKYIILTGGGFSVLAILDLYLFRTAPELYFLLHTLDVGSNEVATLGQFGELKRARGYFVEPNEFSQYLLLPIGLFLGSLKYQPHMFSKRLAIFIFIALFSAQVLSLSRGGFLGVFFQLMMLWMSTRRMLVRQQVLRFSRALLFIVILSITVYQFRDVRIISDIQFWPALEAIFERFLTSGSSLDPTASLRASAIITGLSVWLSCPLSVIVGVGPGNLGLSDLSGATTSNWAVDILAEMGVVGLLSFTTLIAYPMLRVKNNGYRRKLSAVSDSQTEASSIFLLPVVGLLSGGMTYACQNLFVFWLALGLLAAAARLDSQSL